MSNDREATFTFEVKNGKALSEWITKITDEAREEAEQRMWTEGFQHVSGVTEKGTVFDFYCPLDTVEVTPDGKGLQLVKQKTVSYCGRVGEPHEFMFGRCVNCACTDEKRRNASPEEVKHHLKQQEQEEGARRQYIVEEWTCF